MLALRRVSVTAAGSAPRFVAVRALSSTASSHAKKVPALADIVPDSQDAFNSKQKEFREKLAEAQKAQESSASSPSLFNSTRPVAPVPADGAEDPNAPPMLQGLGSLSITGKKGSLAEASSKTPPRKSGPISNLIYGTKAGRELDAQIEASFSQVLARGKYVHSILTHEVKPDKVAEYVDLVGKWYPRMASIPENKVHLVGSWRTEVGDCDTFGRSLPLFLFGGHSSSTH